LSPEDFRNAFCIAGGAFVSAVGVCEPCDVVHSNKFPAFTENIYSPYGSIKKTKIIVIEHGKQKKTKHNDNTMSM